MAGLNCDAIKNKNRNRSINEFSWDMKDDWYTKNLAKI